MTVMSRDDNWTFGAQIVTAVGMFIVTLGILFIATLTYLDREDQEFRNEIRTGLTAIRTEMQTDFTFDRFRSDSAECSPLPVRAVFLHTRQLEPPLPRLRTTISLQKKNPSFNCTSTRFPMSYSVLALLLTRWLDRVMAMPLLAGTVDVVEDQQVGHRGGHPVKQGVVLKRYDEVRRPGRGRLRDRCRYRRPGRSTVRGRPPDPLHGRVAGVTGPRLR